MSSAQRSRALGHGSRRTGSPIVISAAPSGSRPRAGRTLPRELRDRFGAATGLRFSGGFLDEGAWKRHIPPCLPLSDVRPGNLSDAADLAKAGSFCFKGEAIPLDGIASSGYRQRRLEWSQREPSFRGGSDGSCLLTLLRYSPTRPADPLSSVRRLLVRIAKLPSRLLFVLTRSRFLFAHPT